MDGVIDIALHKWKRNDGQVVPAPRGKFGDHLCPVCSNEGEDQVLATLLQQGMLACPKKHGFMLGSISN